MLPHNFPPGTAKSQQARRWGRRRIFARKARVLRALLRVAAETNTPPCAVILDSHTVQPTPAHGARGSYDRAKRRRGSKVPVAEDTLAQLLTRHVTAAKEQDRAQGRNWPGKRRRPTAGTSRWPLSTKAMPATRPPKPPKPKASAAARSSYRPSKRALCFCPAGGSSRAALAGPRIRAPRRQFRRLPRACCCCPRLCRPFPAKCRTAFSANAGRTATRPTPLNTSGFTCP